MATLLVCIVRFSLEVTQHMQSGASRVGSSLAHFCNACRLLLQVPALLRLLSDASQAPDTKVGHGTAQEPLEKQPKVSHTKLSAARSEREDAQEQSHSSPQVGHNRHSHARNEHCNQSMLYAALFCVESPAQTLAHVVMYGI